MAACNSRSLILQRIPRSRSPTSSILVQTRHFNGKPVALSFRPLSNMSGPLADRSNMNMRSSSIVTFNEAKAAAKAEKEKKPKGLNVVPSFSVMSSGMPQEVIAEELIKKGSKKKPVGGQTIDTFFKSITHLHFANKRLLGDIAAITICSNLRVLYVYENRLTTLRGLGGLVHLTHLYAQDNRIESLHDFECPPNLQQLHLGGNKLSVIGGLETCRCLQELHVGSQKLGPAGGVGSVGGDAYARRQRPTSSTWRRSRLAIRVVVRACTLVPRSRSRLRRWRPVLLQWPGRRRSRLRRRASTRSLRPYRSSSRRTAT